jgi:hypothetical protein
MATRPLSPHKTREAARLAGHKRYYTGEPCRHGHRAERFTSSSGCVDCVNQKVSPISGRNVAHLPRPLIFPAGRPDPTPELMEYIQQRVQASVEQLQRDFYTANPEQAPRSPFDGYRLTEKAGAYTLEDFTKLGWTADTLLQNGYIEPVPQPTE